MTSYAVGDTEFAREHLALVAALEAIEHGDRTDVVMWELRRTVWAKSAA